MDTRLGLSTAYSHFNALPTETISQIFCQCTQTFSPSLLSTAPVRSHHTFRVFDLGAVCTRWRSIVWDTPSLWTTIVIYAKPSNINTQIDRLRGQLSRCGDNLPLDIAVSYADGADWGFVRKPSALLETLGPYAVRWRSLLLNIPPLSLLALPGPNVPLPLLTTLLVNHRSVDYPNHTLCRGAINLETLILYNSPDITMLDLPTVHRKLISITLHKCYVPICFHTLFTFRSIQHATFEQLDVGSFQTRFSLNVPINPAPLHLPQLDSLQLVRVQNVGPVEWLLGYIRAPVLTHFLYGSRHPLDLTTFRRFIFEQCPLLASLSLRDLRGEIYSNFIQLLQLCINISTLELVAPVDDVISVTYLSDEFLHLFIPPTPTTSGLTSILPKLETLRYSGRQTFRWPIFIAAWEARGKNRPIPVRLSDGTRHVDWKEWDIQLLNALLVPQQKLDQLAQLGKEHDGILRVTTSLS